MIKIKSILSELETDPNKVFGNIAFGSKPELAKVQGKSEIEPDTEEEKEILNLLTSWVETPEADTSEKLYKKRDILKKASSVFPRILKPKTPNGTDLYRGVMSTQPYLLNQLKGSVQSDYENVRGKNYFTYKKPINYRPRKKIQSWTDSFFIASAFATERNWLSGVVLTTKQNDEFLFNQNTMRILFTGDEGEVIHFGESYTNDVYISIHLNLYKHIVFNEKLPGLNYPKID